MHRAVTKHTNHVVIGHVCMYRSVSRSVCTCPYAKARASTDVTSPVASSRPISQPGMSFVNSCTFIINDHTWWLLHSLCEGESAISFLQVQIHGSCTVCTNSSTNYRSFYWPRSLSIIESDRVWIIHGHPMVDFVTTEVQMSVCLSAVS